MLSKALIERVKKSVVFLGTRNQQGQVVPHSTGFLVEINHIYHLVTAKHVVFDSGNDKINDTDLVVILNREDGKYHFRPIDQIKQYTHCDWMFHSKRDRDIDIAIIPFGLQDGDDVKTIPEVYFLTPDKLFENQDVFFFSFQPGLVIKQKISPIFRRGAISVINEDSTFYIDAAAFPGNSGSPVFLTPSMMLNEDGQLKVSEGGKFIGIIGEYMTYEEKAISVQTGRQRIIFEENTGLSKVWSVQFLNEIINSQRFKDQIAKLPSDQK